MLYVVVGWASVLWNVVVGWASVLWNVVVGWASSPSSGMLLWDGLLARPLECCCGMGF
ncbi:MAG: hypothetical protein KME64_21815 [Scytonematopsis contorta HA4267-MV1]|nr:hypothetical protein [Scytonematopsis contorta HA4267-MV1]